MDPLKVIAAERRRRILELVWDCERTAGDIARHFDVSWPAISQHLKILRDAGYVTRRREGTTLWYRAEPEALGELGAIIEAQWRAGLGRLRAIVEADQATNPGPADRPHQTEPTNTKPTNEEPS